MIFAKTLPLVLSGRKSQTCRLAYHGDKLVTLTRNTPKGLIEETRVETADGRCRWRVGGTLAVQPERCHTSKGRVRVTYLREVPDPLGVDDEFVHAEGFDTVGEYVRIWHELHKTNPIQRCWAIGFELVSEARV